ncbi:MAG: GAF domain-containing sensor histidine kinase [Candidatus Omnitrophica bacterium]|nr:GAF domain-containing sensor histidine kinase [Candidatus Omnitrophota bacterium]
MLNTQTILLSIDVLTIVSLAILLIYKIGDLNKSKNQVRLLKQSLDDMDEQARLIVRTDMELNKTQEELDKKVLGLYALQRLSRIISMTLVEEQIFKRIQPEYMEDLGFEKAFALLWDNVHNQFELTFYIGYSEDEINTIKLFVNNNAQKFNNFIAGEKTLSSISPSNNLIIAQQSKTIFKATSFIIAPILPQQNNHGMLFAGTQNTEMLVTEGDEELIKILSTQLGQALENARLFEKTWLAQQELEKKVILRTAELTEALEKVRSISKRKTDFVSSVSHELRTPLTSIKGYAAILLTGKLGEIPKDVRERLEKINRHSDELVHIVNDLLDIARIESGRMTMKLEICDLKDALSQVEDLLSGQLKERGLYLNVALSPDAHLALMDKTQIERVFINLIGNAMKFTPHSGSIAISSHKKDTLIQVDIKDTGCGIPEDMYDSIFEEFFRVDNAINQEVKGTGLGLSLVKHIIEAHNGKIWVKSKVGSGTTFSFTLPLAE